MPASLLALQLVSPAWAQTPPEPNAAQTTAPDGSTPGTSKDRLFYTLPNFLTIENAGKLPPLTTAEKFKVVAKGSFDYVEFPWYGFLAGLSQAENNDPSYGQGAAGYGKRYAIAFADGTLESFMVGAIFPSFLREDPRYYQLGRGHFFRRTGYAVSRIFVTRTDAGGQEFNFSEIVGAAIAAGIGTYSYHPRGDQTLVATATVWGSQIGYDTLAYVTKEFWPDIRRAIARARARHKARNAGKS